jgi:hypothetical protein
VRLRRLRELIGTANRLAEYLGRRTRFGVPASIDLRNAEALAAKEEARRRAWDIHFDVNHALAGRRVVLAPESSCTRLLACYTRPQSAGLSHTLVGDEHGEAAPPHKPVEANGARSTGFFSGSSASATPTLSPAVEMLQTAIEVGCRCGAAGGKWCVRRGAQKSGVPPVSIGCQRSG